MMEWNKCENSLPKKGTYMGIVKMFKTWGDSTNGSYVVDPISIIMEVFFDPQKGWETFLPNHVAFEVTHWMELPKKPEK